VEPLITYQALCMDAADPGRLGAFWADALGLTLMIGADGDLRLDGAEPWRRVWVDAVPEPKSVKHRVHLDLHGTTRGLLGLGAAALDLDTSEWSVLADPEGGEFCVFPGEDAPGPRPVDLVIDSTDPERLAAWWGAAFGVEPAGTPWGSSVLRDIPGCPFGAIGFMPVQQRKRVKNRIHVDVDARSLRELIRHGATVLRPQGGDIEWTVMADPEGNEFCAFTG
jgi:hypothetical protein